MLGPKLNMFTIEKEEGRGGKKEEDRWGKGRSREWFRGIIERNRWQEVSGGGGEGIRLAESVRYLGEGWLKREGGEIEICGVGWYWESDQHQNYDETDPGGHREWRESDHVNDQMRRLEVPYFSGEDLYRWIYKAKYYFAINQIPEEEKVLTSSICLEGKALNWF